MQDYVAKISGAHLPIVTKPSGHAARIFVGKSSHTDALRAAPEADYLEAIRVAADLARQGQRDEALAAHSAAAEGKITDLQKSTALELAAATARALRKTDVADQLTARIPIAAVKKAVEMQALLDQSKAVQVIEQFAGEYIGAWPFWKRGDGFFARGRAYAITKDGKNAKADLTRALEWTGDVRLREKINKALDSIR